MAQPNNVTIVLADDDEDDRFFFREALEELGKVNFVAAEDGVHLMDVLAKLDAQPDAIFIDINMPRKDGYECVKELRKNPKYLNTPLIVYSTSKNPRDVDAMYLNGASLYIQKSNSIEHLKDTIKGFFEMDINDIVPPPKPSKEIFLYMIKK